MIDVTVQQFSSGKEIIFRYSGDIEIVECHGLLRVSAYVKSAEAGNYYWDKKTDDIFYTEDVVSIEAR